MSQSPRGGGRGRIARASLAGLVALSLIALGAAGATVVLRRTEGARAPAVATPAAPALAPAEPAGDVEVVLSPEALARAGIKTAPVTASGSGLSVSVPGSVMPNAYREVKVTPIAGGIVTKVHVELGAPVRRGTPLITVFSTELADAQTRYLSLSAMLEADHKKLGRAQQLVEIGAASRQELEEITAVHESRATEVEAARQRLVLLGLSPSQVQALKSVSQVVSTIVVPAPINGIITARSANLGQVVAMGQELISVTDLSEVWVIGDIYEQDFKTVSVGSEAAITTPAYPDLVLRGRVTYIDPRVDPQARTAKARIEVPNADGRLRLGMYVTVSFSTPGKSAVVVPRSAVQAIGDRHVVFVAAEGEDGKFIQRQVRLGSLTGGSYTVLSGLRAGDTVVTEGSFFLRAEALRNTPSG
ncbi:MAG: efflux RND transporter periplasmic adaptor subunit [Candidatus Rokubacteria bacterium]|nr:efflux RND transporter periplasmic adaptor subunit [Candidatus Rokubacteria bacterium]